MVLAPFKVFHHVPISQVPSKIFLLHLYMLSAKFRICLFETSDYIEQNATASRFDTGESWTILSPIEQSIKRKIEAVGVPLKDWDIRINYGIKTGFNEAFIINGAKREELIAADPKSAEIIRPILRGRDIKRYSYSFADQWLIATFPSRHYDIERYPAVKKYLLSFGMERLEQTGKEYVINGQKVKARKRTNNKWFETQDSISYWDDFSKQKIVYSEISDLPKFSLDKKGEFFLTNKVFLMTGRQLLLLLAFFNSKLCQKYFSYIAPTTGEGTIQWFKYKVETIPIPKFSIEDDKLICSIVNNIINKKSIGDSIVNDDEELEDIFSRIYLFNDVEKKFIKSL
jgi:hypothetical protein